MATRMFELSTVVEAAPEAVRLWLPSDIRYRLSAVWTARPLGLSFCPTSTVGRAK